MARAKHLLGHTLIMFLDVLLISTVLTFVAGLLVGADGSLSFLGSTIQQAPLWMHLSESIQFIVVVLFMPLLVFLRFGLNFETIFGVDRSFHKVHETTYVLIGGTLATITLIMWGLLGSLLTQSIIQDRTVIMLLVLTCLSTIILYKGIAPSLR